MRFTDYTAVGCCYRCHEGIIRSDGAPLRATISPHSSIGFTIRKRIDLDQGCASPITPRLAVVTDAMRGSSDLMAPHYARPFRLIHQSASLFENALTWIKDALHRLHRGWLLLPMP